MPGPLLPTVAVLNSNGDVLDIVRRFLNAEGFVTETLNLSEITLGVEEILSFLSERDPCIIVYGIAFPYRENWDQWQSLLERGACTNRVAIVTTPNLDALKTISGTRVEAYQLVDQDTDLRMVVAAVKLAWQNQLKKQIETPPAKVTKARRHH